jgi:hypothetical protein
MKKTAQFCNLHLFAINANISMNIIKNQGKQISDSVLWNKQVKTNETNQ